MFLSLAIFFNETQKFWARKGCCTEGSEVSGYQLAVQERKVFAMEYLTQD